MIGSCSLLSLVYRRPSVNFLGSQRHLLPSLGGTFMLLTASRKILLASRRTFGGGVLAI